MPMMSIDQALLANQPTMTAALKLGQQLSGLADKAFCGPSGIVKDAAQWSRIMGGGQHNFPQDKYGLFMDRVGNEAPLLWLLHSRGYDVSSLRMRETETERELRMAREALAREQLKNRILTDALHGKVTA